jgi:hypothetical protein
MAQLQRLLKRIIESVRHMWWRDDADEARAPRVLCNALREGARPRQRPNSQGLSHNAQVA